MPKTNDKEYDTTKILEQMKAEYWKGLAEEVEEEKGETVQLITFRIANELYGIETGYSKEVLKVPKIARVPHTPEWILGVINLRGSIVSVIDLRLLFGLTASELGPSARVVTVSFGETYTGIVVESIVDIVNIPKDSIKPTLETLGGIEKDFIRGQIPQEKEILIILDIEAILKSREMEESYGKG
ncbi:MAG: purine-binding chemotaxis protein CheW [Deltaproteobacteria bacterium]|nr:MAG: purine-binding chemotaxis protein CheW [Deltaproteobacteria bacterium]